MRERRRSIDHNAGRSSFDRAGTATNRREPARRSIGRRRSRRKARQRLRRLGRPSCLARGTSRRAAAWKSFPSRRIGHRSTRSCFQDCRSLPEGNQNLLVLGADVPGNAAGVDTLVEIRMGKAHRECAHLRMTGGKRCDEARIQPSRKQQSDRYVRDQMLRRHLLERGVELLLDIVCPLGRTRSRTSGGSNVQVLVSRSPHAQKVPWRQLMYAIQNGAAHPRTYIRIPETDRSRGDRARVETQETLIRPLVPMQKQCRRPANVQ